MSTQPVSIDTKDTRETTDAQQAEQPQKAPLPLKRLLLFGGLVAAAVVIIGLLSLGGPQTPVSGNSGSLLVWALPVFLTGIISFLSPCTLPILPAYFAFTFQAQRQNIVLMTVSFFFGVATTMTLLGAVATSVSQVLFQNLETLTFWGGLLVIGFGILSLLGKGFAGPQVQERPAASVAGSYLYGATFALGWTACIGPILGALLTILASQGVAVVQGGILAFIYSMGLGLPLILMATFFSQLGQGSRFWKIVRGRGFDVNIGPWTMYLHSTSVLSGVLLILMGYLLASGQITTITSSAEGTALGHWLSQMVFELESAIQRLFGL